MARPYFALPSWSDDGTVSVSTALSTDVGAANLQKIQPKDLWDLGGGSTGYITIDAGSTKAFNLVSLLFTNLTSGATWRIFSAGTSTGVLTTAAAAYDSGSMSAWPTNNISTNWARRHTLKVLSTAQSNRWMRIEITNTGATNIQVGRLYVSNAFQPLAPIRNFRIGHVDPGSNLPSVSGGTVFTREVTRRLRFVGILEGLTSSEYYSNTYDFHRLRGRTKDMLAVLDAGSTYNHHEMIYGILRASETPAQQFGRQRFNLRLDLTELV